MYQMNENSSQTIKKLSEDKEINNSTELNNDSWHFLRNIPKVIGFVGGKIRDGKLDPDSVPTVEQSEIDKMRNKIEEGKKVRVATKTKELI